MRQRMSVVISAAISEHAAFIHCDRSAVLSDPASEKGSIGNQDRIGSCSGRVLEHLTSKCANAWACRLAASHEKLSTFTLADEIDTVCSGPYRIPSQERVDFARSKPIFLPVTKSLLKAVARVRAASWPLSTPVADRSCRDNAL
jgi:hypothetical protein